MGQDPKHNLLCRIRNDGCNTKLQASWSVGEDDEKVPSCGTGRRAGDLQALVDRGWPLHDEQTLYSATANPLYCHSPQEPTRGSGI